MIWYNKYIFLSYYCFFLQEDEMRKEGGKYAHLNEDLHLMIEVYSEISDSYARLSHALSEVQKYLTPVSCLRQELIIKLTGETDNWSV